MFLLEFCWAGAVYKQVCFGVHFFFFFLLLCWLRSIITLVGVVMYTVFDKDLLYLGPPDVALWLAESPRLCVCLHMTLCVRMCVCVCMHVCVGLDLHDACM